MGSTDYRARRRFYITAIKKGAYKRPRIRYKFPLPSPGSSLWSQPSGFALGRLSLQLPLDRIHLILEAQLQLLKPYFFHLFIFGEVALLGEGFQPLGVLRMLLNQPLELLMTGQELVSRSQHPAGPPSNCYSTVKKYHSAMGRSMSFHRKFSTVGIPTAPGELCTKCCAILHFATANRSPIRTESRLRRDVGSKHDAHPSFGIRASHTTCARGDWIRGLQEKP